MLLLGSLFSRQSASALKRPWRPPLAFSLSYFSFSSPKRKSSWVLRIQTPLSAREMASWWHARCAIGGDREWVIQFPYWRIPGRGESNYFFDSPNTWPLTTAQVQSKTHIILAACKFSLSPNHIGWSFRLSRRHGATSCERSCRSAANIRPYFGLSLLFNLTEYGGICDENITLLSAILDKYSCHPIFSSLCFVALFQEHLLRYVNLDSFPFCSLNHCDHQGKSLFFVAVSYTHTHIHTHTQTHTQTLTKKQLHKHTYYHKHNEIKCNCDYASQSIHL